LFKRGKSEDVQLARTLDTEKIEKKQIQELKVYMNGKPIGHKLSCCGGLWDKIQLCCSFSKSIFRSDKNKKSKNLSVDA
jgi:hypothetical protein